jgi:phosphoglycolate phosphatase-like HAD superfamily hydrolase
MALRKVLDCPFVPGAEEALAALGTRYPLFVASGTPQDELDRVVEARGLRGHFREVWGSPREKANILADIAARHELRPDQILFIGDGASDERAAAAAGTEFLARSTVALADHWARSGARAVPDLTGLVDLVATW